MLSYSEFVAPRNDFLIQLHGASKQYSSGANAVTALRPASLTLERGEFVLLEGPSGSGKTTLLSILGLLMKPTSGHVCIAGEDATEMGEDKLPALRLKHIGFIFQSFNLFPALSALENIKLVLKLKGYSWNERRKEAPRLLE